MTEPEKLRALADELRIRIVQLLRERAASTTEIAANLALPKGTVGHHLKVLERAGLVHVVRTRKVRAVTEKYYGRVARLFVIKGEEPTGAGLASVLLVQPAVRLRPEDVRRFERRLQRLVDDFRASEEPDGTPFGLVVGLYPTEEERA